MKRIIQFLVTRGDTIYTAEGVNVPIVTEGNTFEKLQENIQEAVELYFEGEDPAELGFGDSPAVLTSFELAPVSHGNKT